MPQKLVAASYAELKFVTTEMDDTSAGIWSIGTMSLPMILVFIDYECHRDGNILIPWDEIAHRLNPGSSSQTLGERRDEDVEMADATEEPDSDEAAVDSERGGALQLEHAMAIRARDRKCSATGTLLTADRPADKQNDKITFDHMFDSGQELSAAADVGQKCGEPMLNAGTRHEERFQSAQPGVTKLSHPAQFDGSRPYMISSQVVYPVIVAGSRLFARETQNPQPHTHQASLSAAVKLEVDGTSFITRRQLAILLGSNSYFRHAGFELPSIILIPTTPPSECLAIKVTSHQAQRQMNVKDQLANDKKNDPGFVGRQRIFLQSQINNLELLCRFQRSGSPSGFLQESHLVDSAGGLTCLGPMAFPPGHPAIIAAGLTPRIRPRTKQDTSTMV
ncbi:uncharacterized protein PAC_19184 [Phialocephala subalpina]|uniref:Uncharacterized protein n=1 Tax=Phialocephala subalpina TaxID=576137 RepID=A0A1L7XW67_9HELO|nr:uncharacterized protein PAC_19184 [Phialocephala subalpina]